MSVFDNFPFRNSDGRTSLASLSVRHIITPRRAGITIASAFACVGIASAMSTSTTSNSNKSSQSQKEHTIQLKLEKKATASSEPPQTNTTPPAATEQHVQSNVSLNQSVTASGNGAPTTTNDVSINGKHVSVPKNGTVKKVITEKNGNTSVHITSNSSGSASNTSSSSISVDVTSDSSTSSSSDTSP